MIGEDNAAVWTDFGPEAFHNWAYVLFTSVFTP